MRVRLSLWDAAGSTVKRPRIMQQKSTIPKGADLQDKIANFIQSTSLLVFGLNFVPNLMVCGFLPVFYIFICR
jgi:hypothetical protein